jgi:hypothetical protein
MRDKTKPRQPTLYKYHRAQPALPEKEFLAELAQMRSSKIPDFFTITDRPTAWLALSSYFFVVLVQFAALYELGCFYFSDDRSPWIFTGIAGCLIGLFFCITPIKEKLEFLRKSTKEDV